MREPQELINLEIGQPIHVREGRHSGRGGYILATNARTPSEDGPIVLLYLLRWQDKDRIVNYSQRAIDVPVGRVALGVEQLVSLIRNSNDQSLFRQLAAGYADGNVVADALGERDN